MQTNDSSECQNQPYAAQVDGIVHLPRSAWFFHAAAAILNPATKHFGVFVHVEYELSVSWSGDTRTFELWSNGMTRETVLEELARERARHPERVFRVEAVLTFTAYSNSVR